MTGVGSETRNAIYHLHNGRDIILLTTCKHGFNWQDVKDERCDADNAAYDKYDYTELLDRSLFCLVPRGRRLATYRFLEALKSGCVPVLLSNGWVLPFGELLDWSRVVVWADERALTQIVPRLRAMPRQIVAQMSQLGVQYYREYFSSIETIMLTTLQILDRRISRLSTNFSTTMTHILTNISPQTLYLSAHQCRLLFFCVPLSNNLIKLSEMLNQLAFIDEIFLISCQNRTFHPGNVSVLLKYYNGEEDMSALIESSKSECIISLREDYLGDEKAFKKGVRLWQDNKDSIVSFHGLSYSNQDGCFRLHTDLRDGYYFMGLEFAFLKKSYLSYLFKRSDLWATCKKALNSFSDVFFQCLTPALNMIALKSSHNRSFILLRSNHNGQIGSYNYSSTCIDYAFQLVFKLDRTIFEKFVNKKFHYFD